MIVIRILDLYETDLKSTFRTEPEDQVVYAGDMVVLQCSPPKGRPTPTVHWLRDTTEISNSSRTFVSAKGNLTIFPVIEADQGSYICKAKNPLGERESQQAFLTVKGKVLSLSLVHTCEISTSVSASISTRKC